MEQYLEGVVAVFHEFVTEYFKLRNFSAAPRPFSRGLLGRQGEEQSARAKRLLKKQEFSASSFDKLRTRHSTFNRLTSW
jgi:hypothetical protein